MTDAEMNQLLAASLPREPSVFERPSLSDWRSLEQYFDCQFGADFKSFINYMSEYAFPGDMYNVSGGNNNGNDPIKLVYEFERQHGTWPDHLIPFYGIGNGDYFCLNRDECPSSPVYYWDGARDIAEQYSSSFEAWVRRLPEFLSG